jgi:transcriptional regulator with XRE-family HTH domain
MTYMNRTPVTPSDAPVGVLLAQARKIRRLSQLELAGELGISTRHLSFLETGRARPSRGMLLRLCETLNIGPRETDSFLLAAGFAPAHKETPLEAPAMAEVIAALQLLLSRHQPLPAAAFDGAWDLVMVNEAYSRTVNRCLAAGADPVAGRGPVPLITLIPAPRPNLLRLLCHPDGARNSIVNWAEVTRAILRRAIGEMQHGLHDPARQPPIEEVLGYPGVKQLLSVERSGPLAALVVPTVFRLPDGSEVRMVSTIATLGTAQDLTLRELRIETYHPADTG